jgi:hypothetical protein
MDRSHRLGRPKSRSIPFTRLAIFTAQPKPQLEEQHLELTKLEIFTLFNL